MLDVAHNHRGNHTMFIIIAGWALLIGPAVGYTIGGGLYQAGHT